ncbi:MAG: hypothetical protein HOH14_02270 [Gammaproteobacteria bacterium]|nr:hypothetical protein [Gammaproteobacteria bacterium]
MFVVINQRSMMKLADWRIGGLADEQVLPERHVKANFFSLASKQKISADPDRETDCEK